jgi:hypothetical protein
MVRFEPLSWDLLAATKKTEKLHTEQAVIAGYPQKHKELTVTLPISLALMVLQASLGTADSHSSFKSFLRI